jgi:hypothetical protein
MKDLHHFLGHQLGIAKHLNVLARLGVELDGNQSEFCRARRRPVPALGGRGDSAAYFSRARRALKHRELRITSATASNRRAVTAQKSIAKMTGVTTSGARYSPLNQSGLRLRDVPE